MRQVPTYALYGEAGPHQDAEFLHCETIQSRSRLHGFHIRPHRHVHLVQMLFLTHGIGDLAVDGAQAALVPPCLVLLPPLVVHGYSFSNDVRGLVLTLVEGQLAAILRLCPEAMAGFDGPLVIPLAHRPAAARAIATSLAVVAAEFAGYAPGRLGMMHAHLAIAWLAAHRARLAPPGVAVTDAQARGAGHVARFRQMIERDFRARSPVEDYARRLGMTPVHLRRLCRLHLGATPLEAINARVVLEAKRLLVFTSLGVKEVAAAVGFADHAYFSRFFQRETGSAPTALRATRRTTAAPPAGARRQHCADTPPAAGRRACGRNG